MFDKFVLILKAKKRTSFNDYLLKSRSPHFETLPVLISGLGQKIYIKHWRIDVVFPKIASSYTQQLEYHKLQNRFHSNKNSWKN